MQAVFFVFVLFFFTLNLMQCLIVSFKTNTEIVKTSMCASGFLGGGEEKEKVDEYVEHRCVGHLKYSE